MFQTIIASKVAILLAGVFAGALTAPLIGRATRPVLRQVIKGGIVTQREILRMVDDIREDVSDLVAEAKSELGEESAPHHHHTHAQGQAHA